MPPDYTKRPGLVVIIEILKVLSVALRDMGGDLELTPFANEIAGIADKLEALLPHEQS